MNFPLFICLFGCFFPFDSSLELLHCSSSPLKISSPKQHLSLFFHSMHPPAVHSLIIICCRWKITSRLLMKYIFHSISCTISMCFDCSFVEERHFWCWTHCNCPHEILHVLFYCLKSSTCGFMPVTTFMDKNVTMVVKWLQTMPTVWMVRKHFNKTLTSMHTSIHILLWW